MADYCPFFQSWSNGACDDASNPNPNPNPTLTPTLTPTLSGQCDTNYKPELNRSQMEKSMQLGKFECLGSCRHVYKVQKALQGHVRKCLEKNKVGLKGQNGCWQPGYKKE